jgi:hypothetical protein
MMQPNFSNMTDRELKDYALAHRENDEVVEELIQRVELNDRAHPYPETDEDLAAMERAFLRHILQK